MERISLRKPFQGIANIVRFNWHFYLIAAFIIAGVLAVMPFLPDSLISIVLAGVSLTLVSIALSLAASYYVYDRSNLYTLDWMKDLNSEVGHIVNINAGFDETSHLIAEKFKNASLKIFDFYDPAKHTEVSIERARKAYPAHPETRSIETNNVPLEKASTDIAFLMLAAHEIRNTEERILFFKQLCSALKPNGKIVVVEHLRDLPNFIVYNIGFLHFHSKQEWMKTFSESGFQIETETKITPFISAFILTKNGITA